MLELPRLANDDTLSPRLRRWARFFAHPSEAELAALAEEDEIMAETVNELRDVFADEVHRQNAESRLRNEFAYHAELAAERSEGIAIGEAKLARAMLRRGIPRAEVAAELGIAEADLDAFLAKH